MKIEITTSHAVLPHANGPVEVTALVELISRGAVRRTPLDLRFLLDHSASMGEQSGIAGETKLHSLTNAVCNALDLLTPGADQVSAMAFSNGTTDVIAPTVLASDVERSRMKRALRALRTAGGTAMASSLELAMCASSLDPQAVRRVVIFTDGEVNGAPDEMPRCLAIAERAVEAKCPLAVFAVGTSYDEQFLRALVLRAGLGSTFAHLDATDRFREALAGDIAALRSSAECDLAMTLRTDANVTLLDVMRLVPQQIDVPFTAHTTSDRLAALDERGQRYLVRCRVDADAMGAGVHPLFDATIAYREGNAAQTVHGEAFVELTADASHASAANPVVLATVANAAGVRAATQGNVDLARTLFTHSGNAAMLQQLTVLGSAAAADQHGDAARSLRTVMATRAHALPTLGGTPPARTP